MGNYGNRLLMVKKDKEASKLMKYLKHWAEHNDSHKESYIKWKEIAESKGLESIATKLGEAIEWMDKSTAALLAAHDELAEEE